MKPEELTYGITEPPVYMTPIMDRLGIGFARSDSLGEVSGSVMWKNNQANILVNSRDSHERQRFTAAHEVAHYILHMLPEKENKEIAFNDSDRTVTALYRGPEWNEQEQQANDFAAELLMPRNLIEREFDSIRSRIPSPLSQGDVVSLMADKFKVSKAAMEMRLKRLGILSTAKRKGLIPRPAPAVA